MVRPTLLGVLAAVVISAAGCGCPTVAGPTGPLVTGAGTLSPNEARAFDVETPNGTTQINVQISWVAGLAVWQVHADCPIETVDQCTIVDGSAPSVTGSALGFATANNHRRCFPS